MINFRQREDVAPSAMILLSIVILAGSLAIQLLMAAPSADATRLADRKKLHDITKSVAQAQAQQKAAVESSGPRLWTGNPQVITATILAQLTDAANHHGLKLGAFRPDRSQDLDGLTELRFSAQLAGSYSGLRTVMRSLDMPGGKVALRSVDMAVSQAGSGGDSGGFVMIGAQSDTPGVTPVGGAGTNVTATLGLSAYMSTAAPPATAPSSKESGKNVSGTGDKGKVSGGKHG